jgi:DNA-binding NtrC family response regulator
VLVVEDDAGIRNMLGLALASLDYEARLSLGDATLDASGVDVVILDVRLGSRSAIDVLREHPELRRLPLILSTAGDPAAVRAHRPDALVLRKPFDFVALEEVLASAISAGVAPG